MVDEISYKAIKALTQRDLDVAELMAQGRSNKDIASALDLSTGTIKNYTSNLIHKLGAVNRVEAAVMLTEAGVFSDKKTGHCPD